MEASQQASEGAPVLQAMDENYKEALESQKKAQREARLAAERAANEYSNRRKCLDLERQARQSQTTEPALVTTAKQTPRKFQLPVFGSGMYVEVEPDMSPGKCSNGGNAHVQAVVYKDGEPLFTVEYDENSNNGRVERDVPLWRLKEKSYGSYFRPGPRPERECTKRAPLASLDPQSTRKPPPPERDLIDELKHGWTQNRKRGWRASDLGVAPRNRHCDRSTEFKRLFLMDLQFLRGYHKVEPVPYHSLRCKETGHFKAAKKEGQPISVKYLCKAWGVGKNAPADFEQQSRDGTLERKKRSYDTLIDGGSNAEAHFDPKVLYINVHVSDMREAYWASSPTGPISLETIEGWKADANVEWTLRLSDSEKAVWEFMSRTRLEKLQHLKGDLLEALNSNVTKSYRALASDAEGLVSWTTIYRFMKSQGVCLYTQRPLPLLSDLQKERHVAYCVHRLNNWGLPPQKTLLINFDEKWWYGKGNQANAKLCKSKKNETTEASSTGTTLQRLWAWGLLRSRTTATLKTVERVSRSACTERKKRRSLSRRRMSRGGTRKGSYTTTALLSAGRGKLTWLTAMLLGLTLGLLRTQSSR